MLTISWLIDCVNTLQSVIFLNSMASYGTNQYVFIILFNLFHVKLDQRQLAKLVTAQSDGSINSLLMLNLYANSTVYFQQSATTSIFLSFSKYNSKIWGETSFHVDIRSLTVPLCPPSFSSVTHHQKPFHKTRLQNLHFPKTNWQFTHKLWIYNTMINYLHF